MGRAGAKLARLSAAIDAEHDAVGSVGTDLIDALRGKQGRVSLEVYRHGDRRTLSATLDTPRTGDMMSPRFRSWTWQDNSRRRSSSSSSDEYRSREDLEKEVSDLRREIDRLRRELEDSKRER